MGTGFYGSNDPTNSVKALKEHTKHYCRQKTSEGFTTVSRLKAFISSDMEIDRQLYSLLVQMTTVSSKAASSH